MESNIYIFHREDMFYPLELEDDEDAILNAKNNKGTLFVENLKGEVVWSDVESLEKLILNENTN